MNTEHIMDYTKEPKVRDDFNYHILINDLKKYVNTFKSLYAHEIINENPSKDKVSWIIDRNNYEDFLNECKSENIYVYKRDENLECNPVSDTTYHVQTSKVVLARPTISHNGKIAYELYEKILEIINRIQYSFMYDYSDSLYYDEFRISEFVERFECNFIDEVVNSFPTKDRFAFPYKHTDEYKFEFENSDYNCAEHIDMCFNSPVQRLSLLDDIVNEIESWVTNKLPKFKDDIIDLFIENDIYDE